MHTRAFGAQSAFTSGMRLATGEAVVVLDGDLQDPPELIPELVERWREGYEIVYAERADREGRRLKRWATRVFYRLFSRVSYVDVPVDAGDFGLMDRRAVDALNRLPETHRFIRGLRAWVGFRQSGVPFRRPARMFGRSTNSLLKNLGWARRADHLVLVRAPRLHRGARTRGGLRVVRMSIIGSNLARMYEEGKARLASLVDEVLNAPQERWAEGGELEQGVGRTVEARSGPH